MTSLRFTLVTRVTAVSRPKSANLLAGPTALDVLLDLRRGMGELASDCRGPMTRALSDQTGGSESMTVESTCHQIVEEAQAIAVRLEDLAQKRAPDPDAAVDDLRLRLDRMLELISQLEKRVQG